MVVAVEAALRRGNPAALPPQPVSECFDLADGRARDQSQCGVALSEVHERSVDGVGYHRTARTAFRPLRAEHEVINHELRAAGEELGQRYSALGPVEYVILFDFDPGQFAPVAAELVAEPSKHFLFFQQRSARLKPFFVRNYGMYCLRCGHVRSPYI